MNKYGGTIKFTYAANMTPAQLHKSLNPFPLYKGNETAHGNTTDLTYLYIVYMILYMLHDFNAQHKNMVHTTK